MKHAIHEHEAELAVEDRDTVFLFRPGDGLHVYGPLFASRTAPASEEAVMAAMMAWAMTTPGIRDTLREGFAAWCEGEAERRRG